MTPKQKAEDLMKKFAYTFSGDEPISVAHLKECVMITIDEIIEEVTNYCDQDAKYESNEFYKQVKIAVELT